MNDDVEICEGQCPKCKEWDGIRFRYCDVIGCDDGYIDEHDSDPINFAMGEEYILCHECLGTGVVHWCSKCGADLSGVQIVDPREDSEAAK